MSQNDFYLSAAQQRATEIQMELSAARADLDAHRYNQDLSAAGEAVQRIANLTAEQQNLKSLCDNYVASMTPREPEALTDSERFARPWTKMSPQDGLDLAKTSRYVGEKGLSWDDPNVRSGYAEAQRRRSRGE
jgi:hypothetical protein